MSTDRSVLHAAYELLPTELYSEFLIRTIRDWHEHCTTIPRERERQKEAYRKWKEKQLSVLNPMLHKLWNGGINVY
jgi:hypothetical protein